MREERCAAGVQDRGEIAPGKLADLLVVDCNPANDITDIDHITAVWHRGKRAAEGIAAFTP